MPTYTFKREECCGDQMQLWTDFMTIAEKEKYLKDNPDVRQVLVAPAIVSGVQGMTHKEDSGWKENMQRISEPIQTHHLQKDMVTVSQMRKRKQDRRLIID